MRAAAILPLEGANIIDEDEICEDFRRSDCLLLSVEVLIIWIWTSSPTACLVLILNSEVVWIETEMCPYKKIASLTAIIFFRDASFDGPRIDWMHYHS